MTRDGGTSVRTPRLLLLVAVLSPPLVACGGRSYRLGSEGTGDPDASSAAQGGQGGTSGGRGGNSGSGGTDSDAGSAGEGGSGGSAGAVGGSAGQPTTIVDVDGWPPLYRGEIQHIVSEPNVGVAFLAADDEYVYFNNWGGAVWRVMHDGSGRTLLADTEAYHLAVDGEHVYWSRRAEILRVPKAGGRIETVATLDPYPDTFAMWLTPDDSYVYASTYGSKSVVRAPKAGGPYETLAETATTIGGVSLGNGSIFFADYTSSSGGTVQSKDLATSATRVIFRSGAAMMLTAGNDVWLTHPGGNFDLEFALARVPLDGSRPTGYRAASHSFFFAGDEHHIYWVRNGLLGRVNRASGREETVAEVPAGDPEGLAITEHWVFVADRSPPGGIFRVLKLLP
jgi:hypothetical protein